MFNRKLKREVRELSRKVEILERELTEDTKPILIPFANIQKPTIKGALEALIEHLGVELDVENKGTVIIVKESKPKIEESE